VSSIYLSFFEATKILISSDFSFTIYALANKYIVLITAKELKSFMLFCYRMLLIKMNAFKRK
jgi:hypothetical protein